MLLFRLWFKPRLWMLTRRLDKDPLTGCVEIFMEVLVTIFTVALQMNSVRQKKKDLLFDVFSTFHDPVVNSLRPSDTYMRW